MNPAGAKKGFVLSLTMIMSLAAVGVAVLVLKQGRDILENEDLQWFHQQVSDTLENQVDPVVKFLDQVICSQNATTAMLSDNQDGLTPAGFAEGQLEPVALSSGSPLKGKYPVSFNSHVSSKELRCAAVQVSPPEALAEMRLAWLAEDISLGNKASDPPDWWPMQSWYASPDLSGNNADKVLSEIISRYDGNLWIDIKEPLPFSPEASPALVPVVRFAGLRFGVFASGKIGNREKVIRIRYYIDCSLWNPYNRPIRMHDGGGRKPVFRIAFWNLPEIRVHNHSQGVSTAWTKLDTILNTQSGETGIHAWIQTEASIEPGETINLSEPDIKSQPEGLARILHPAFMIGPADQIKLEFRESSNGTSVACLPLSADQLDESGLNGSWFLLEDFETPLENLTFPRADGGDRPFYLHQGSIGFREYNTHFQVIFKRNFKSFTVDPRMLEIKKDSGYMDANGDEFRGADLVEVSSTVLMETPGFTPVSAARLSLFSWPGSEPENLLEASDLPSWENGFRIGSRNSVSINSLLDNNWPTKAVEAKRVLANDSEVRIIESIPANCLSPNAWKNCLETSAFVHRNPATLAYYRFPSPVVPPEYHGMDTSKVNDACVWLAENAFHKPVHSVGDFFNRGILHQALGLMQTNEQVDLMPMRGWLRGSPPLKPHGSAWIIHLAVFARKDQIEVTRTARVWLLKIPDSKSGYKFSIIRFEWTDPEQHLAGNYSNPNSNWESSSGSG